MLVWLASYPRSGNTLVRTILKECFGLTSEPLYGEGDNRSFATAELRDTVGHASSGLSGRALISHARAARQPALIKTHEGPLGEDKTIHIVRDGRSAIVSYFHFLRDVERQTVPIERIIEGQVYAGSWSGHYRAWSSQPDRLLLRYERIVADPDRAVEEMAEFIGRRPSQRFTRDFAVMRALHPSFFRAGDDTKNIRELTHYQDLFERHHGAIMRELDYS